MTYLYFIVASEPDQDTNLDLFVEAENKAEAVKLWVEWASPLTPGITLPIPRVFLLPMRHGSLSRRLKWHTDVVEVR